ncbi:hypothetical protein T4D_13109 [Trichinella pseudospiralis]|uniref:Uncharacterized protein n=1 Tax=Trichinella pseudospiralis TaxID=6337 RepID=A0A0V1G186_TRIPS|nr:hypothetical protein T4D_13109 [Trichinella pseudospiralis]
MAEIPSVERRRILKFYFSLVFALLSFCCLLQHESKVGLLLYSLILNFNRKSSVSNSILWASDLSSTVRLSSVF